MASDAVIKEEWEKNHHLLAYDLEHLLYGGHATTGHGIRKFHNLPSLPTKYNCPASLDERAVVREEKTSS